MSLDLSKATRLRDLVFRCRVSNIRWIVTALGTVKSKNLQQITIRLYPTIIKGLTEEADPQDLDRMLVQFWISHLIRPRFIQTSGEGGGMRGTVRRVCCPS